MAFAVAECDELERIATWYVLGSDSGCSLSPDSMTFDDSRRDEIRENMLNKVQRKPVVQKRAQNKKLLAPSGRKEVNIIALLV